MPTTIDLGKNRSVRVDISYGEKKMPHLRNAPEEPHKTTTINLFVREGSRIVRKLKGVCYCSPADNFNRIVGRKLALRRAIEQDSVVKGTKVAKSTKRKPVLTRLNRRKIYETIFPQYYATK